MCLASIKEVAKLSNQEQFLRYGIQCLILSRTCFPCTYKNIERRGKTRRATMIHLGKVVQVHLLVLAIPQTCWYWSYENSLCTNGSKQIWGCILNEEHVHEGSFPRRSFNSCSTKKPSLLFFILQKGLVEESNDMGELVLTIFRCSCITEYRDLSPSTTPHSEEKECVWDTYLPPSGNFSPYMYW